MDQFRTLCGITMYVTKKSFNKLQNTKFFWNMGFSAWLIAGHYSGPHLTTDTFPVTRFHFCFLMCLSVMWSNCLKRFLQDSRLPKQFYRLKYCLWLPTTGIVIPQCTKPCAQLLNFKQQFQLLIMKLFKPRFSHGMQCLQFSDSRLHIISLAHLNFTLRGLEIGYCGYN